MQFLRLCLLIGLALAAALTAACSQGQRFPETGATLEGTVTYRGQKVSYAMIIAAGGEGGTGSASGYIGDDNRYKLENVPLGDVKIAVISDAAKGQLMASSQYAGPDPKAQKKAGPKPAFIDVDKKFASPETSGISTKVVRGKNEYNIEIK